LFIIVFLSENTQELAAAGLKPESRGKSIAKHPKIDISKDIGKTSVEVIM
jgi:hypothetical protein